MDIFVPVGLDPFAEQGGVDPRDRFFTGRVNGHDQQYVGLVKGPGKLIEQGLGARVAVRLKDHHLAPVGPALFQGLQGGFHLCRVMAVVIYHRSALYFAFDFQAPLNPLGGFQGFFDGSETDSQFQTHRDGGHGIVDIVNARHVQADITQVPAMVVQVETTLQPIEVDIFSLQVCLAAEPVGRVPVFNVRDNILDGLVIQTEYRQPIKWDAVDKIQEDGLDVFQVLVEIQVFLVDVGDDRDGRREFQETAVAFICFGHDKVALAQHGVDTDAFQFAADDDGGVQFALV